MKKLITLFAIAGMVLALAPAVHAQITIMDPTTNEGSFEEWTGSGYDTTPPYPGIDAWTFVVNNGGLWRNATPATHGDVGIQNNQGGETYVRATTYDLLTNGDSSGAYSTVNEGDVFTYSLDYHVVAGAAKTISYSIDFGNGPVVLESVVGTTGGYQSWSGTHTATATDAAGGQLAVLIYLEGDGQARADNAQLSVVAGTPAATPGTLIYGK
jgi:hypothetical protein